VYELSPTEAYDAWQSGDVTIIDIREHGEHDQTNVPGVALIPMSEIQERVGELPGGQLVIMCRSGARSAQVAHYLEGLGGHGEVANLDGGIIGWAVEGLPYDGEAPR
jgi:rhodanese-related sulfurtransferase